MSKLNVKTMALRLFWTIVSVAAGALGTVQITDSASARAAGVVVATAVVNAVLIFARQQLGHAADAPTPGTL